MSKKNDRYVVKDGQGWAVKKAGRSTAESKHRTQQEAERAAKETVRDLGGGEVRIQNQKGRWRDSDTVAPAPDPFPPRDTKH